MNFIDFVQFVKTRCMYETIYEDSDSNLILVIRMLDAYAMAGKFGAVTQWPSAAIGKETLQDALKRENGTPPQRTWVGLTPQERDEINEQVYGAVPHHVAFHAAIEQALREKNT